MRLSDESRFSGIKVTHNNDRSIEMGEITTLKFFNLTAGNYSIEGIVAWNSTKTGRLWKDIIIPVNVKAIIHGNSFVQTGNSTASIDINAGFVPKPDDIYIKNTYEPNPKADINVEKVIPLDHRHRFKLVMKGLKIGVYSHVEVWIKNRHLHYSKSSEVDILTFRMANLPSFFKASHFKQTSLSTGTLDIFVPAGEKPEPITKITISEDNKESDIKVEIQDKANTGTLFTIQLAGLKVRSYDYLSMDVTFGRQVFEGLIYSFQVWPNFDIEHTPPKQTSKSVVKFNINFKKQDNMTFSEDSNMIIKDLRIIHRWRDYTSNAYISDPDNISFTKPVTITINNLYEGYHSWWGIQAVFTSTDKSSELITKTVKIDTFKTSTCTTHMPTSSNFKQTSIDTGTLDIFVTEAYWEPEPITKVTILKGGEESDIKAEIKDKANTGTPFAVQLTGLKVGIYNDLKIAVTIGGKVFEGKENISSFKVWPDAITPGHNSKIPILEIALPIAGVVLGIAVGIGIWLKHKKKKNNK